MILHSIDNAITPVRVLIDAVRVDANSHLTDYQHELAADLEHIDRYMAPEGRGRRVVSYLGDLTEALKRASVQCGETIDKIDGAIPHISDILTLQLQFVP